MPSFLSYLKSAQATKLISLRRSRYSYTELHREDTEMHRGSQRSLCVSLCSSLCTLCNLQGDLQKAQSMEFSQAAIRFTASPANSAVRAERVCEKPNW